MAVLVLDCPHCKAENTSFTVRSSYQMAQGSYGLLASCGRCQLPVSAFFKDTRASHEPPENYSGDLRRISGSFLEDVWPQREAVVAPDSVPEAAASAFVQATKSLQAGCWDAACAMYRRAMELGLKKLTPDVKAWNLAERINKLAEKNLITPDLRAWANELRLDGNEAVHGDKSANEEFAEQMHGLCKFLLIYLYTLPEQVKEIRTRRASGK